MECSRSLAGFICPLEDPSCLTTKSLFMCPREGHRGLAPDVTDSLDFGGFTNSIRINVFLLLSVDTSRARRQQQRERSTRPKPCRGHVSFLSTRSLTRPAKDEGVGHIGLQQKARQYFTGSDFGFGKTQLCQAPYSLACCTMYLSSSLCSI